jgi:hypothetical protein
VTFVRWLGDDTAPDVGRSSIATEGLHSGDDTGWLVVWQHKTPTGWAVWGVQKGPGETDVAFPVTSRVDWDLQHPALALADDDQLLIAYEGDAASNSTVEQHIYGRLQWPGEPTTNLPLVMRGN